MTATTFASRLKKDGSLTVPTTAIAALGLNPGDEVQVQLVVTNGNNERLGATLLESAIYKMTHRTPEQLAQVQLQAMELYPPVRTVPSGKTLADVMAAYAVIDAYSKSIGLSMGKNDVWIAAVAHFTGFELLTTDHDFDHLHNVFLKRTMVEIDRE